MLACTESGTLSRTFTVFVHPAALVPRAGKDLVKRLPEAERTVTNGKTCQAEEVRRV